ncbi:MAG TPA: hypothetical protein VG347_17855 [Verrucomicrobiae bacterium]|nr:hypothetical protein [Verrucomicrobiae bacterium]
MEMPTNKFPQDKEYELSLLLKTEGNFKALDNYLDAYIKTALDGFEMPQHIHDALYRELHEDVPVAAERYLKSDAREKDYKFSTYFSWYVSERLNKNSEIKRKTK